ncbi:hypothetical protein [Qipengyuania nanhaisediminis]|uniref:hypothetical protein n=1 Tax=Qipengyuania nanhaisediminis TaxID=604088 RepID=UPI0038B281C3
MVLAHVFADAQGEEWERTQLQYLIRTFWMLLGSWLVLIFVGFWIGAKIDAGTGLLVAGLLAFAFLILASARTIYAMVHAVREKPMKRSRTWLV